MSALTDADLDHFVSLIIGGWSPTPKEVGRLVADLREARAERDALRALVRAATVEIAVDDGPEWEWTTRCPAVLGDDQATLLRSILDGAPLSATDDLVGEP